MISTINIRIEGRRGARAMHLMLVFVAAHVLCSPVVWAVPPQTEGEIVQLLSQIGNSDCAFERNGTSYTPSEARAHIERKYEHTRRYIKTSEDFIKYTATESSITGRPYRVRCGDVDEDTADWLKRTLKKLRGER